MLVACLAAAPALANTQTVNIPSVTISVPQQALARSADGYWLLAEGLSPRVEFAVSSSGTNLQFNLLLWYRYPFTSGNGPLKKSGSGAALALAGDTSNPLITGGNVQSVPFTVTNETGVVAAGGGIATGCYVVLVVLVTPGTITTVGSSAGTGVRVGSPAAASCSSIVNVPPNCDVQQFLITPAPSTGSVLGGNAVFNQPSSGSCHALAFNANGGCSDMEGETLLLRLAAWGCTTLNYRWDAFPSGSSTAYATKLGISVSFMTGLPGLELPAGNWTVVLTVTDSPANASLTLSKTLSFNNQQHNRNRQFYRR
ncbi:hypothetical protein GPECTOR_53g119 [Gonium pectorale]|uniref:Uncharacterized protein n=1 Tax=Gonium pectorale TaxID=33097 RepID=A0A150G6Y8_GONPE|nr:hypothetical protein GPECTOR_53g119 [Gonium pectorale]|eukprot:KXZ45533.1 hypothetical protein GPECTOR_53g119 [Gonium pectorale]